jgi:AcrR family transcriptional regulator
MDGIDKPTKGERTRAAILDQATAIASRLGLEGLTIGSLAEATGLSKSGLFAHFGSREELQVAVLEDAALRFANVVAQPSFKIARGLPRLRALFEYWLDWSENAGLGGGCPILAASFEYDDRPGRVRDTVVSLQRQGVGTVEKAVRLAVEAGHLRADTDVKQMVYELYGFLLSFYLHGRLLNDREAHRRAMAAFDQLVSQHLPGSSAATFLSPAPAGFRN